MTEKTVQDIILEKVIKIEEQIVGLRIDVAILKAKATIYGSIGGAIIVGILELIKRII